MATVDPGRKIIAKSFIHSCHLRGKCESSVIVKEKIKYDDGTIEPNLTVFENPKRCYYITQPKYRSYRFKPEYELVSRLDKFTCHDWELHRRLALAFDLGQGYVEKHKLFKSPYVFGADISIEALIKMHYLDNWPDANLEPTVGFLDIETSIETNQIIIISYAHDDIVHTAILESFLYKNEGGKRVAVSVDELTKLTQTTLASRTAGLNLTYDIKVFDSEIKIIAWIMKCVHDSQTDFISIWNMNFDIPKILDTIKTLGFDAAALFTSPKLPLKHRYARYYEDMSDVAHFTLKWHWLYSSCGSQFIDAMGLYSQCRRTAGFRDKYDLNSVLQDEVNHGKLPLAGGSHIVMQRDHFPDYVVYNIFDVVGLRLLEDKNRDVLSMSVLAGATPVSSFNRQTIRATNNMYHNLIGKGMVLSACSRDDDFVKYDRLFPNVGGAVLPPSRVRGVGVQLTI